MRRLRLSQFGWQMAVAEVPGDADQRGGVGGADLGERFGRGDDLDDAAVLELQPVASAQHHRLGQIEQEVEAAHAGHRQAAPIALVVVEHDRIGRLARPGAGGKDSMSMQHRFAQSWRPRARRRRSPIRGLDAIEKIGRGARTGEE